MITYWVNAAGRFTLEQWLSRRAPDLTERFELRSYESLTPELSVAPGAHIFSALDQLGPRGRRAVTSLYDRLSERRPAVRLLNDPHRVLGRRELLDRLAQTGINRYRVFPAAPPPEELRFPVFIREEAGHGGPLTRLLESQEALRRALRALQGRGYRAGTLLVVEFCDLGDGAGVYRTAAANKVGDRIIAAHQIRGSHWMLKWSQSEQDERAMREFRDYSLANPHAAWVRRVFELAGVDYGRIDYGIRGDTLQAWEINLNPTIGPPRGPPVPPLEPAPVEALLQEGRRAYIAGMREAFLALDPATQGARLELRLDAELLRGMHAEFARERRRRSRLELLHAVYERPLLGRPFRALLSWLLPRG